MPNYDLKQRLITTQIAAKSRPNNRPIIAPSQPPNSRLRSVPSIGTFATCRKLQGLVGCASENEAPLPCIANFEARSIADRRLRSPVIFTDGSVNGAVRRERSEWVSEWVRAKQKAADYPAEVLVLKEGFDDKDKLRRTVLTWKLEWCEAFGFNFFFFFF